MKSKFILTEEESKRILSLHKKKIAEEREDIEEVDTNLGGVTAASAGGGAIAGAAIGSVVPVIGTAIGSVVGAVGGGILGYISAADGEPKEIVKNIIKKCRTERKTFTKPTKSQARLSTIAGDIRKSFATWGWTSLEDLKKSISSCDTIVDFCNVTYIYSNTFGESLWNALDGDIDANEEWLNYVLKPLRKLSKQTKTINPNQGKQQLTPEEKRLKAKTCGYSSWDEYKNSGWKCKKPSSGGGSVGGGSVGGGNTYTFDYNQIITAINQKCPGGGGGGTTPENQDIVNPFGQGGEQGQPQVIKVTDEIYAGLK